MDDQKYKDFLSEIANKVNKLILKLANMDRFRNQMRIFGEMRETWSQTRTQYKKIAEADPRLRANPLLADEEIKPPKQDWIWDNRGEFWRPKESPPDPMDWVWPLGSSAPTRPPNDEEKLMCDYFLLTVVHDGALTDAIDKRIYFKRTENGMWRDLDGGSITAIPDTARLFWEEDLSKYKRGLEYHENDKTKSKIERALEHVQADLARIEQNTKAKATIAAILISLFTISIFVLLVWLVPFTPFTWLKNHPNSYSLQGGIICLVPCIFVGLFKPQWRKLCWGVALLPLLVLILSLLGGPADSNGN